MLQTPSLLLLSTCLTIPILVEWFWQFHVGYPFEQQWSMLIPTVVSSARVQRLLGLKKHASSMENHLILQEAASFGISNQLNSKLQLICLQRSISDVAHLRDLNGHVCFLLSTLQTEDASLESCMFHSLDGGSRPSKYTEHASPNTRQTCNWQSDSDSTKKLKKSKFGPLQNTLRVYQSQKTSCNSTDFMSTAVNTAAVSTVPKLWFCPVGPAGCCNFSPKCCELIPAYFWSSELVF